MSTKFVFQKEHLQLYKTSHSFVSKQMYNSGKNQPTLNAFGSIFLDYSNISKLDDQYTKKTTWEEDSISTTSMPKL